MTSSRGGFPTVDSEIRLARNWPSMSFVTHK